MQIDIIYYIINIQFILKWKSTIEKFYLLNQKKKNNNKK